MCYQISQKFSTRTADGSLSIFKAIEECSLHKSIQMKLHATLLELSEQLSEAGRDFGRNWSPTQRCFLHGKDPICTNTLAMAQAGVAGKTCIIPGTHHQSIGGFAPVVARECSDPLTTTNT